MYEEELRNLQNDLNQKDQKISQLEKEQKQLYKKYKSLKGKSQGNFNNRLLCLRDVHFDPWLGEIQWFWHFMCQEKSLNFPYPWPSTRLGGHRLTYFIGRDSGNMELEFKEFENQTDDSLMSEAEKVKLEVLQTSSKSSY